MSQERQRNNKPKEVERNKEPKVFEIISILRLREIIKKLMEVDGDPTLPEISLHLERCIEDFVFLSFFFGNDYLPAHAFNLKFKYTMDMLLELYKRLPLYLTNVNGKLNYKTMTVFLAMVQCREEVLLKSYDYHSTRDGHYGENRQRIVDDYMTGLSWMWQLYSTGTSCSEWNYEWEIAPFIGDLVGVAWKQLPGGSSLKPFTHLMMVMPKHCSDVFPKPYRSLIENISQYYDDNGYINLKQIAILRGILEVESSQFEFTDEEKERNEEKVDRIFFKNTDERYSPQNVFYPPTIEMMHTEGFFQEVGKKSRMDVPEISLKDLPAMAQLDRNQRGIIIRDN